MAIAAKIVRKNAVSKMVRSSVEVRKMRAKLWTSLMFQATTIKMAASAESGIWLTTGESHERIKNMKTACNMPAIGVCPPVFTLAAVRAMAPVAGIPPNAIDPMLAIPCAISSQFDRCLPPLSRSPTIAERSDSIPP